MIWKWHKTVTQKDVLISQVTPSLLIKEYHTGSYCEFSWVCHKEKGIRTEMWITLNICLYLSFNYISATFISDSCQLQGHFKLNGMYQVGDFIIGGLFEVQHLKVFPELTFRTEPELSQCEEWVWIEWELLCLTKSLKEKDEK